MKSGCDDTNDAVEPIVGVPQKRAYQKPELIEFGNVRELTRSGSVGPNKDFGKKRT